MVRSWMVRTSVVFLLVAAISPAGKAQSRAKESTAGTAPYFGIWRCDPARSDLGPVRFRIGERSGDYTYEDLITRKSYRFRIDGKDYVDVEGFTVTWSSPGPRTWHVTYAANGKRVSREVWTVAPDDMTMTVQFTVESVPPVESLSLLSRQAGAGSGLAGEWHGKLVPPSFELLLQPQGGDGLLFRIPGAFESTARFDGKPYPLVGPMIVLPSTATFTRTGPRSFRSTQHEGARPLLDATFTVSEDGRTLTEPAVGEGGVKRTWVFDRIR